MKKPFFLSAKTLAAALLLAAPHFALAQPSEPKQPYTGDLSYSTRTSSTTSVQTMAARAVVTAPRVQTNLESVTYWGTSFPFADLMKQADTRWTSSGGTVPLNANGWPTALPNGQRATTIVVADAWRPAGKQYNPTTVVGVMQAGDYRLDWTGQGDVSLEKRGGTGSVTLKSTGTRTKTYTLSGSVEGIFCHVNSINSTTDYPRGIKVWQPGQVGNLFHSTFASDLINFPVVRFMDWGNTNNSGITNFSQRRLPSQRTQGLNQSFDRFVAAGPGVAYEYMVQLANQSNADLWICIPHLATQDFRDKLAKLIRYGSDGVNPYSSAQTNPVWAPLKAERRVWVEYSNEVWNPQFAAHHWLNSQSIAGTTNLAEKIGSKARNCWTSFATHFPDSRLVRVLSGQFANAWFLEAALATGYDPDILAVQSYFYQDMSGNKIEDYIWNNNLHNASDRGVALTQTFDQLSRRLDTYYSTSNDNWKRNVAAANNLGIPLVAYEGGPHIDAAGRQGTASFVTFIHDLHRDNRMGDLVHKNMQKWMDGGGKTPSVFSNSARWHNGECWGHKEFLTQTNASKYNRAIDWIFARP